MHWEVPLRDLSQAWKMYFQFPPWHRYKMKRKSRFLGQWGVVEKYLTFFSWLQALAVRVELSRHHGWRDGTQDRGWGRKQRAIATPWAGLSDWGPGPHSIVCTVSDSGNRPEAGEQRCELVAKKIMASYQDLSCFLLLLSLEACSCMLLFLQWLSRIPSFNRNASGSSTDLLVFYEDRLSARMNISQLWEEKAHSDRIQPIKMSLFKSFTLFVLFSPYQILSYIARNGPTYHLVLLCNLKDHPQPGTLLDRIIPQWDQMSYVAWVSPMWRFLILSPNEIVHSIAELDWKYFKSVILQLNLYCKHYI